MQCCMGLNLSGFSKNFCSLILGKTFRVVCVRFAIYLEVETDFRTDFRRIFNPLSPKSDKHFKFFLTISLLDQTYRS